MAIVFETKDVTRGNIRLTDERWKHILNHPEMQDNLEEIQYALQHPIKVTSDHPDPNVRYYYRYHKHRHPAGIAILGFRETVKKRKELKVKLPLKLKISQ